MSSKSFTTTKEEEKLRIDTLIANRFADFSRSYVQYLLKEGMVKVNDKVAKKKDLCKENDQIEITTIDLPDLKLTAENIPLEILFEDEDIIVCNKPAGMVTHPAPGSITGTFAAALLFYLKTLPESNDPLRPGIVHRLDKETSGILVAAKSTRALTALQKMFAERKMKKTYLAICHGTLKDCSINAPIGRHPHRRKEMKVMDEGKEALTHFSLLGKSNGYSLVEASPYTGRTHQIRVHARHVNAPIVGDRMYGRKKREQDRHLLHAYKLSFKHPFSGKELEFIAPPSPDFLSFLEKVEILFG